MIANVSGYLRAPVLAQSMGQIVPTVTTKTSESMKRPLQSSGNNYTKFEGKLQSGQILAGPTSTIYNSAFKEMLSFLV